MTGSKQGILPDAAIRQLIADGAILLAEPPADTQVQPASLDLRLGPKATRVRASFLPGPSFSVADKLRQLALHEFDLSDGSVLETGCVYIVPLLEALDLPFDIAASANPKSSTGRLDVFTRVITDEARAFDKMPEGYSGPLYLEVSPRTFPILVRTGSRLSQVRFRRGGALLDDAALKTLHAAETLATGSPRFIDGLALSIDLQGDAHGAQGGLVGYRAKRYTGVIDVDKVGAYDVADFWEPIRRRERAEIVLDPAQFYILVSAEAVHVPALYAAEMVPFDPLVGEFRVHYAGFFDPGFGHAPAGGHGSRAVLEVRSHEVPFILEHGQTIGRLVYEKLAGGAGGALRLSTRLELPGAGPEALEAFPRGGMSRSDLPQKQRVVGQRLAAVLGEEREQVGHVEALTLLAGDVEHDPAFVQHHDAVAVIERLAHRVGDHQGRQLLLVDDLLRQREDELRGLRVERRSVLVEEQDLHRLQRRHQKAHRLSLSSGQKPHAVAEPVLEAKAEVVKSRAEIGAAP